MKEIVVLEKWDVTFFKLRLVTDGEDLWVEYKSIYKHPDSKFWRKDKGFEDCPVDAFNQYIPAFS